MHIDSEVLHSTASRLQPSSARGSAGIWRTGYPVPDADPARRLLPSAIDDGYGMVGEGGSLRGLTTMSTVTGIRMAGVAPPVLASAPSAGSAALIAGFTLDPDACPALVFRLLDERVVRAALPPFDTDHLVGVLEQTIGASVIAEMLARIQLFVPMLCVKTGNVTHLRLTSENWRVAIPATCAVPVLSARVVEVDGGHYIDGSIGLPLAPVHDRHRRGAPAIAVLSRPESYRRKPSSWAARTALSCMMPGVGLEARRRWFERYREDARDRDIVFGRAAAPVQWHAVAPAPGQVVPSRVTFDRRVFAASLIHGAHRGISFVWGDESQWPDSVAERFESFVRATLAASVPWGHSLMLSARAA